MNGESDAAVLSEDQLERLRMRVYYYYNYMTWAYIGLGTLAALGNAWLALLAWRLRPESVSIVRGRVVRQRGAVASSSHVITVALALGELCLAVSFVVEGVHGRRVANDFERRVDGADCLRHAFVGLAVIGRHAPAWAQLLLGFERLAAIGARRFWSTNGVWFAVFVNFSAGALLYASGICYAAYVKPISVLPVRCRVDLVVPWMAEYLYLLSSTAGLTAGASAATAFAVGASVRRRLSPLERSRRRHQWRAVKSTVGVVGTSLLLVALPNLVLLLVQLKLIQVENIGLVAPVFQLSHLVNSTLNLPLYVGLNGDYSTEARRVVVSALESLRNGVAKTGKLASATMKATRSRNVVEPVEDIELE